MIQNLVRPRPGAEAKVTAVAKPVAAGRLRPRLGPGLEPGLGEIGA